jgi:hypothetical protein
MARFAIIRPDISFVSQMRTAAGGCPLLLFAIILPAFRASDRKMRSGFQADPMLKQQGLERRFRFF